LKNESSKSSVKLVLQLVILDSFSAVLLDLLLGKPQLHTTRSLFTMQLVILDQSGLPDPNRIAWFDVARRRNLSSHDREITFSSGAARKTEARNYP
jgi:hypothetical protein